LLAAAAPGLGIAPALLFAIVLAGGWPGIWLGVFRVAGLTGPLDFEVFWANDEALLLEGEPGRFDGGLVPTILSGEGFLDQGNILKLGVFHAWQPVCELAKSASKSPARSG